MRITSCRNSQKIEEFHKNLRLFLIISLLFGLSAKGFSQTGISTSKTDIIIKASFIYNFAKHSKWPDSGQEGKKFKIAVIGDRNVYDEMVKKYSTRAIQLDQSLEIVWATKVDELEDVQVVYVSKSKNAMVSTIMSKPSLSNILVISDSEVISGQKAAISFTIVDSSISFNVNKFQARKCNIQIGNRILGWANNIVE